MHDHRTELTFALQIELMHSPCMYYKQNMVDRSGSINDLSIFNKYGTVSSKITLVILFQQAKLIKRKVTLALKSTVNYKFSA